MRVSRLSLSAIVRIEAVTDATSEVHAALAHLLAQLNSELPIPTMERLRAIVADPAVTLLLARDAETVVGTTTVIVYTTPFWVKGRLDEVVVDEAARGKGVGAALVNAALEVARQRGAQVVELQSGLQREAANRLYPRLGFKRRETNVYRITLD